MNIKTTLARKPWIMAALVAIGVAIWMASGMKNSGRVKAPTSQIAAPGDTDAVARVQVATMHAEPVTRVVTVYGRTAPTRTVTISAETEGRVAKVLATRGIKLAKGDPILELDMRDRQARVDQARASVREHETAYKAQKSLEQDGYVSETQIAETLAKLETARAELTRAQLDLANRVLRAPFDGVLQDREVEVGDFVKSGDPVATFVDNLKLIVKGTLAEKELAGIEIGDAAKASLVTGQRVNGRVRYIAPVADEETRTFAVEVEIDNTSGSLPAGVTAEMVLERGEALAQKMSPALLTLDAGGTLGVYIVDEFQRAAFVPVSIERTDPDGIWVSGLPDTANVVTVGQGYISPGQEVEPVRLPASTAVAAESLL